jgi:CheY-like chemotaxis protein
MKSILVLEDDPSNLEIFSAILWSNGYEVLEASTPEEALNAVHRQDAPIDLLVSGVGLGISSSGVEVAVALAKDQSNLPILFVTGTPLNAWSQSDRRNLDLLPAASVGVLEKPFLPSAFESAVAKFVG